MQRIHVVGRKNHGKTGLVVDLVREFTRRGVRVGTIKPTHHRHELDVPGKDSQRHREAGAGAVGVLSGRVSAVFVPVAEAAGADRYELLAPLFQTCDLVLVEGDSQTAAPKIEVWRAALGTDPMALTDSQIQAVVTDDLLNVAACLFSRQDVPALADWLWDSRPGLPG